MSIELTLQKWISEYKKGFSKPLILFTLSKLDKSYPFPLTKEILRLTNGMITIAGSNIYPILRALEKDELITGQPDENKRKYYMLTDKGIQFLNQLKVPMKGFNDMIGSFIEINGDSNKNV